MFVDTAKVYVKAGKGGNGAISFRHEIYIPKGGPDGGDGGKGGDVVFIASKDCDTLVDFRFQPKLIAEDGKAGSGQKSSGKSGKDLLVEVPIGTVVKRDGEIIADLTHDQERAIIAHGGDGGYGNWHFRSSTRQVPKIAELGNPGEAFDAELELKLLADVGLVGFPNAGKSTFLSVVSNATPEIADYPFTTITPNLGVAKVDDHSILIADIPGLIEGASEGKGLGDRFLRHVERTKVLLHLIDVYNEDAGKAYSDIRTELANYSAELASRPELVVLTKTEGVDDEIVKPLVARWRPTHDPQIGHLVDVVDDYRGGNYGFFSAHASNTFSIALFFSLLVRYRWFTVGMVTYSLVNCWTRLYLGVHYPGDILVGLLWGTITALTVYSLFRYANGRWVGNRRYTSRGFSPSGYEYRTAYVSLLVLLLTFTYAFVRPLL